MNFTLTIDTHLMPRNYTYYIKSNLFDYKVVKNTQLEFWDIHNEVFKGLVCQLWDTLYP